jgi:hypothetical protein
VIAPVGSALLGLSVEQSIEWCFPDGRPRTLLVVELLYQPEAAGNANPLGNSRAGSPRNVERIAKRALGASKT